MPFMDIKKKGKNLISKIVTKIFFPSEKIFKIV